MMKVIMVMKKKKIKVMNMFKLMMIKEMIKIVVKYVVYGYDSEASEY